MKETSTPGGKAVNCMVLVLYCLSFVGLSTASVQAGETASKAAVATGNSKAQSHSLSKADESLCRQFVVDFYKWYAPKHTLEDAVKERGSQFSAKLYKALVKDIDAAGKSPDEIVGLDFDPILNGQDIADRYRVGKCRKKDGKYFVDVYSEWKDPSVPKSKGPDIVTELSMQNGRYVFDNFHYGETKFKENENLLSILKVLENDRLKYSNKAPKKP
ncbi:MAG: hypothetical protein K2Y32_03640 [Candidatus Obscuribacterales bacterium]|nr:hypothetical protein [Candidatus Obscuribacterales bacterium]